MTLPSRIMYIESKGDGITGPAPSAALPSRRAARRFYYRGKRFRSLKGAGFKSNYYEVDSGDEYWISGCKRSGDDRLYSGTVQIDDDVPQEYWVKIRNRPESKHRAIGRSGKYSVT